MYGRRTPRPRRLVRCWAVCCTVALLLSATSGCHLLGRRGAETKTFVFTANLGDDTVSVVDGALDREVKVLPTGRSPQALAVRADPPLLAVANSGTAAITLIDPVTLETLPDVIRVGLGPEDVAFSADGQTLFATSYYDKTVSVMDVATRAPRRAPLEFPVRPRHVLTSRDGRRLYVLLHDADGAVAIVDLPAGTVVATIPVGPFPADFVLSADGRRLYVSSFDKQHVSVIDTRALAVVETFALEVGYGLALHPSKPLLYSALSFEGEVLVYDLDGGLEVTRVAVGEWPLRPAITPDGRFLYVPNEDSNNLVKLDTATNRVVTRIAVGMNPNAAGVFTATE